MIRHLLAVAVCVIASIPFAGCGASAPPPESKSVSSPGEDLSTPEGASAAVDRAERAIDQMLGVSQTTTIAQQGAFAQSPMGNPAGVPQTPPAAPPAPPPPPPPASLAPEGKPAEVQVDGHAHAKSGGDAPHAAALDTCNTACSALASMERATEHLCSLAGAADDRCTSARARVKSASTRVHATCPACRG